MSDKPPATHKPRRRAMTRDQKLRALMRGPNFPHPDFRTGGLSRVRILEGTETEVIEAWRAAVESGDLPRPGGTQPTSPPGPAA